MQLGPWLTVTVYFVIGSELLLCVKSCDSHKKKHICVAMSDQSIWVEWSTNNFPSTLTDIRNTAPRLKYFSMFEISQFCS